MNISIDHNRDLTLDDIIAVGSGKAKALLSEDTKAMLTERRRQIETAITRTGISRLMVSIVVLVIMWTSRSRPSICLAFRKSHPVHAVGAGDPMDEPWCELPCFCVPILWLGDSAVSARN